MCILSQLNLLARIYDWYYSVGYRYQDDTCTIILLEEQNMLDADIVGKLVNDISYELDLEYFGKSHGNVINITKLKDWYDTQEISHKKTFEEAPVIYSEAIAMLAELKNIIDEEEAKPIIGLATSELREFYGEFMSGKLHPKLRHHQQQRQRLMLEDSELCDASGITHLDLADAARSRRFIDLMIMKYKPADMGELRSLFSSDPIIFISA